MLRTVGERAAIASERRAARRQARKPVNRVFETAVAQPIQDLLPREKSKTRHGVGQLKIDVLMLLCVFTLVIFGLIMVYSASYDYSLGYYGSPTYILYRQLIWLSFGIAAAIFLTFFDYHRWRYFAVIGLGTTIFMLIVVLFVNEIYNNAARTLYGGSIQPSELAKLMMVLYLAVWLYAKREKLGDVSFGLIPLAAILGLVGGTIALQPDLSAVVTIFFLGGLMFFLAGGDLKQIGVLLILAFLVGYAVFMLYPTGSSRLQFYFAGLHDPTQGSYHVQRSFEAFINGGWLGVGIGKGVTKLTGLPVPHTDSIFAVVGEETGVLGAAAVVCLYSLFLWRGLVIARRAPDELGALIAAGLTVWISAEAFLNMAVMVNLLPFAGNALPFISSGGSSLIVSMAAIGTLLNISRQAEKRKEENGKFFNTVVNLRGWDRGRGVSSPRRPANPQK